jgi:hypothetical protein
VSNNPQIKKAPRSVIFFTNLISSFLRAITTPIYVGQKSVQVFNTAKLKLETLTYDQQVQPQYSSSPHINDQESDGMLRGQGCYCATKGMMSLYKQRKTTGKVKTDDIWSKTCSNITFVQLKTKSPAIEPRTLR